MDGIAFLSVLSTAMFLGSYLAGSVPLLFNFSESRMRMISIFGAGLLIGTALSVIIPEGVETLYNAKLEGAHGHQSAEAILQKNEHPAELPRMIPEGADLNKGIDSAPKLKREAILENNNSLPESVRVKREDPSHDHDHEHAESHGSHGNIHKQIGLSLVVGFIFMLLVDQISSTAVSRTDRNGRNRMGVSATIGLVVHAAADGIALGSASTINKSDVQLIVFVAIMLHKAPAAFGLVSFLLLEQIDHRNIKKHLLVFSFAAPFAALVTYMIILNSGDTLAGSDASTGVLMLFSAGTFLYVATVHVLPELANGSKAGGDYSFVVDMQSPGSVGHSHSGGVNFTVREMFSIIAGAIVPAILASGHSH